MFEVGDRVLVVSQGPHTWRIGTVVGSWDKVRVEFALSNGSEAILFDNWELELDHFGGEYEQA